MLAKLREAEKAKAEADKQAYIDPEKAEQAREEGNVAFKVSILARRACPLADSAVGRRLRHGGEASTTREAIKRLPSDPKAYNNRAAAYTKLLAMPEALKDANEAIKLDQTFVKAYIRKALVQQAMKDHTAALETLQKATEVDTEKKVRSARRQTPWAVLTGAAHARARVEHDKDHDGAAAAARGRVRGGDVRARHARSRGCPDHGCVERKVQ